MSDTLTQPARVKPREPIVISPCDRFCIIGKTRSGKSFLTLILMTILLPFGWPNETGWQVWWVDTKGERSDRARLKKWGFLPALSAPKNWPRLLFSIRSIDPDDEYSVAKQVQALCWSAFKRNGKKYANVIIVIDEYVSVILSKRNAGSGLLEVFQRGGGLHVGLAGETQEPVDVPRQLASQATHQILLNLTHPPDIEWAVSMCPEYATRVKNTWYVNIPDKHGFWYKWIDGPRDLSQWMYFPDVNAFKSLVRLKEAA